MKTNWKNLSNYDYLGSYSFDGKGVNEITVTIKGIEKKSVIATGGVSSDCIIATFAETKIGEVEIKPMILNKTNCKTIASLYGNYVEDWVGKKIIVYVTTTKMMRDMVECLRIKKEKPVSKVCSVSGKEIEDSLYNASIEKYGVAVCSKECLEKKLNNKGEEE